MLVWGAENTSFDKRRSLAADATKRMSRTKSLAPLAASKNLVKWSSPAEPQAATRKLPPIKRVSRESNFSESPRSSATGDMAVCHAGASLALPT